MYSNLRVLRTAETHERKQPSYGDANFPLPGNARIAVVHDWLPVYAGAERVLEQMIHVVPDCELYSLIDFLPDDQRAFLRGKTVATSFIQHLPFARRNYRFYLPCVPFAIEQFDLTPYQVVVSSSYVAAKGVLTTADQLHVSYVHSPVRYAWDLHFQYLKEGNFQRGARGWAARLVLHYMRLFDTVSAMRVDHFIANSRAVARRIWKTYRRRADVVYPPVDVDAFQLCREKEDYYVTASRFVPYKRIDLIVQAFAEMPEKQLVVIGDGPEFCKIAATVPSNVKLLGHLPFESLRCYLQHARAFVFAAEEDFGIAPVEAQACGTPVVAFGKGGVTETVVEGETGVFFHEQNAKSLKEAIETLDRNYDRFSHERIRENALRFSCDRFRREFAEAVGRAHSIFFSAERH